MPNIPSKDKYMKKQTKVSEVFKNWIKKYGDKNMLCEVHVSPTLFLVKTAPITFTYKINWKKRKRNENP